MGHEVSLRLIEHPDTFGVLVELGGIVGPSEETLKKDRVRNPDRLEVLHCARNNPIAERIVALKIDLPDLDLRSFIDFESDLYRGGWDLPDLGSNGRILTAPLRFVFLQNVLRSLDFAGVELRLGR